MPTMKKTCPQCGEPLRGRAIAGGLCPKCLLKLGVGKPGPDRGSEASTRNAALERGQERPARIGPYKILDVLGEGGMVERGSGCRPRAVNWPRGRDGRPVTDGPNHNGETK